MIDLTHHADNDRWSHPDTAHKYNAKPMRGCIAQGIRDHLMAIEGLDIERIQTLTLKGYRPFLSMTIHCWSPTLHQRTIEWDQEMAETIVRGSMDMEDDPMNATIRQEIEEWRKRIQTMTPEQILPMLLKGFAPFMAVQRALSEHAKARGIDKPRRILPSDPVTWRCPPGQFDHVEADARILAILAQINGSRFIEPILAESLFAISFDDWTPSYDRSINHDAYKTADASEMPAGQRIDQKISTSFRHVASHISGDQSQPLRCVVHVTLEHRGIRYEDAMIDIPSSICGGIPEIMAEKAIGRRVGDVVETPFQAVNEAIIADIYQDENGITLDLEHDWRPIT